MSLFFDYEFDAPVSYHDVGSKRYQYTVVFVPRHITEMLPLKEHPRLRISAEINDYPVEAALTPVRGRWYILLSKKLLTAIERSVGEEVTIRFGIADQDAVEVPPDLQDEIDRSEKTKSLWVKQTPGMQRALAYRVSSAKRQMTREKRIAEVIEIMEGKRDLKGNTRL